MLVPAGWVVAVDGCQAAIERLRSRRLNNVEAHPALIESFAPTASFDWIVMTEVIEYLRSPEGVVQRALGWLAPEGRLLLTAPAGRWDEGDIEHLHVFDLESVCRLLARAGATSVTAFLIPDAQGRHLWIGAEAGLLRPQP